MEEWRKRGKWFPFVSEYRETGISIIKSVILISTAESIHSQSFLKSMNNIAHILLAYTCSELCQNKMVIIMIIILCFRNTKAIGRTTWFDCSLVSSSISRSTPCHFFFYSFLFSIANLRKRGDVPYLLAIYSTKHIIHCCSFELAVSASHNSLDPSPTNVALRIYHEQQPHIHGNAAIGNR